jgi:hypothetical protein
MDHVSSKDGTKLGFERTGQGPPVILVCGGSVDRHADDASAIELSRDFTVLALWEPPFIPEGVPHPPEDQVEQYESMVAEGRRGDAVEYFMTRVVGMPPEFVAGARQQPWWAGTEALAHTLAYDARIMGDYDIRRTSRPR